MGVEGWRDAVGGFSFFCAIYLVTTGTRADTFGVEDAGFEFVENSATVVAALDLLSDRERHVLTLRFFEDRTQSEIAAMVGVSQMQISRILRGAISRLTELTHIDSDHAVHGP